MSSPQDINNHSYNDEPVAYSPNDTTAGALHNDTPGLHRFNTTGDINNGILMKNDNNLETVNEYRPLSVSSERGGRINFGDFSAHGHSHGTVSPFRKRNFSYGAAGSSPTGQLYYTHHNFYNQLQQHGSRISLGDAAALDLPVERLENLHEMRPLHLIGKSCPMRDWNSLYKSDEQIAQISRATAIRDFYSNQNELMERYQAIDRLLDSGMPQSMLRVYGDDLQVPESNTTTNNGNLQNKDTDKKNLPNGIGSTSNSKDPSGTASPNSLLNTRQGAPANIDIESSPLLGESREEKSNTVMFAIYVNFAINFVLLVGKAIVALLTNSLSVVASLVDSILDFLSTFIIWVSTRLVDQRDWKTRHLYPVGRSRLEPIGVLVFSVLIIVSFLKVGDEALEKLYAGRQGPAVEIGIPSIIIMTLTIFVKVFCYFWCRSIDSSAVQALAQDAMTDIVFNTFSMLFPLIGHWFDIWWLDPFGALALSLYIIHSWGATAMEHINNLTGSAASPEDRQVVLYLCMRFSDSIKYITALNAYHVGDRITVEVDIVLDEKFNLRDCHDIAESLQYAIETLPFVERAFVHLDYRRGNFTGHLVR